MRWKQTVTALMLSAALAVGFVGCSKEEPAQTESTGAAQEGGGIGAVNPDSLKKAVEDQQN